MCVCVSVCGVCVVSVSCSSVLRRFHGYDHTDLEFDVQVELDCCCRWVSGCKRILLVVCGLHCLDYPAKVHRFCSFRSPEMLDISASDHDIANILSVLKYIGLDWFLH